jgi:hypothetical protein
MPRELKTQVLTGSLQQLLFSPKGGIEGLLLSTDDDLVQVSMKPENVPVEALAAAVGQSIRVTARPDRSPKAAQGLHPVYVLEAITSLAGKPLRGQREGKDQGATRGVVAAIHFAKHGEPNGVILETGEFVHTRPPAMKKLKLRVGSKVVAKGERRATVLGSTLIEAREVNRLTIT